MALSDTYRQMRYPPSDLDLVDKDSNGVQPQSNRSGAADPTPTDDTTKKYHIGSYWVNTVSNLAYMCVDDAAGAAVWLRMAELPVSEAWQSSDGSDWQSSDATSWESAGT